MDKYSQALTFGKNIIVTTDLNCDMLKPRSLEAVALQDLCDSVNLTQLIKESTRMTETSSTLIEVIMTSSIALVERSGVLKSHISDHYLVYALLKLKVSKPPPSYVKVRSYKNYDSQCFVSDLAISSVCHGMKLSLLTTRVIWLIDLTSDFLRS